MTVRAHGASLPISLMLLGSYLTFRFVGLLLLPLGGFLWTRRRRVEICDACAAAGRS